MKKENISKLGMGYVVIGVLLLIYNYWKFQQENIPEIRINFLIVSLKYSMLSIPFACMVFLFAAAYFILHAKKIPVSNGLTISHAILTVIGLTLFFRIRLGPIRGVRTLEGVRASISLGLALFCMAIVLMVVNIAISIANKRKKEQGNLFP